MNTHRLLATCASVALLGASAAACGAQVSESSTPSDGGPADEVRILGPADGAAWIGDAHTGHDATPADASAEATSRPVHDAAVESDLDAGLDAAVESGLDAGLDASVEGGADGRAGTPEAGADGSPPDAAPTDAASADVTTDAALPCVVAVPAQVTQTNPYDQPLTIFYAMVGGGGGAASMDGTSCAGNGGGGGKLGGAARWRPAVHCGGGRGGGDARWSGHGRGFDVGVLRVAGVVHGHRPRGRRRRRWWLGRRRRWRRRVPRWCRRQLLRHGRRSGGEHGRGGPRRQATAPRAATGRPGAPRPVATEESAPEARSPRASAERGARRSREA